ncbi:MAG: hypothetical protein JXN59_17415 [Anaerolineae bacterium]|nr:hypothetical protein [Anaerolineae bacterium]
MKHMVMLIMTNPDHCMDMLEAWDEAGAPGITILETTGLNTLRKSSGVRDDLPLMPSLADIFRATEEHHRTIFSVVNDEAQVEALMAATERVFDRYEAEKRENSAVVFVLPVSESRSFITSREREKVARAKRQQT